MKANLTLSKHPDENRYLMTWYNIQIGNIKFSFKVDDFMEEDVIDKLINFHCKVADRKVRERKCKEVLEPYIETIVSEFKKCYPKGIITENDREGRFSVYSR